MVVVMASDGGGGGVWMWRGCGGARRWWWLWASHPSDPPPASGRWADQGQHPAGVCTARRPPPGTSSWPVLCEELRRAANDHPPAGRNGFFKLRYTSLA